MQGSPHRFRIDRERAVKLIAMAGLAVLGASTLPGLLKTPDPPPIPANVGFRPDETSGARPDEYDRWRATAGDARRTKRKPRAEPKKKSKRRGKRRASGRRREEQKASPGPDSTSGPEAPGATVPTAAGPVTAPAPPAVYSPPSTIAVPPSPSPGDGSQEFAPR